MRWWVGLVETMTWFIMSLAGRGRWGHLESLPEADLMWQLLVNARWIILYIYTYALHRIHDKLSEVILSWGITEILTG